MKKNVTKLIVNLALIEMFAEAAGQLEREGYFNVELMDDCTVVKKFPTHEELELLMEKTSLKVFRTLVARNVNLTRKNAKEVILSYLSLEQVKDIIVKKFELVKN